MSYKLRNSWHITFVSISIQIHTKRYDIMIVLQTEHSRRKTGPAYTTYNIQNDVKPVVDEIREYWNAISFRWRGNMVNTRISYFTQRTGCHRFTYSSLDQQLSPTLY